MLRGPSCTVAITSCPLDTSGNLLPAPINGQLTNGSGCAALQQRSLNAVSTEDLYILRMDYDTRMERVACAGSRGALARL